MAKKLTSAKAKKILHDKSVHGHPLTEQQRKFFGAIAGGAEPYKAEEGGWLNKYEAQDGIDLDRMKAYQSGKGDMESAYPQIKQVKEKPKKDEAISAAKKKAEQEKIRGKQTFVSAAPVRSAEEQRRHEEFRKKKLAQIAANDPMYDLDETGELVKSGYARFIDKYGKNLDKFASSLETPLIIESILSGAPAIGKGLKQLGKFLTNKAPVTNAYRLPEATAPFIQEGQFLAGKDIRMSYPEGIEKLKGLLKERPVLGQSEDVPIYFHGSTSANLPLIAKNKGLLPYGEVVKTGEAPLSGELFWGITEKGINQSALSTVSFPEYSTAADYALGFSGRNKINVEKKLADWFTGGKRQKYVEEFGNSFYTPKAEAFDDLLNKKLTAFQNLSDVEKEFVTENYPVMFGISPKTGGADRFINRPRSDIYGEVGISGNVPLEEIPSIFVPKSRIKNVQSLLGDQPTKVLPIEDILTAEQLKLLKEKGYKNGGWLDKYEQGGMVLKQKTHDNYGKKPNANNSDVSLPPGFVGLAYNTKGRNYSPAWGGQFAMGGSIPGAVGFTYARTAGAAPSNGPYAKKTKASAQDGKDVAKGWLENWYRERQEVPEFTKLASERVAALEKDVPVELRPAPTMKKINALATYDPRKRLIEAIDPATMVQVSTEMEPTIGVSPYVLGHEMVHYLDVTAPQTKSKGYDYPISVGGFDKGVRFVTRKESGLPSEDYSWITSGAGPQRTEVNAVLYGLRQAEGLKGNKPTTPAQMEGIIKKYKNLGEKDLNPATEKGVRNLQIRTLIDSFGGDAEKLSEINNRIVKSSSKKSTTAQNGQEMKYYQEGLDFKPKTISQDGSEIPVDPDGYWNPENVGNPVIIPSTDITMEGVDQPLIGISDTGDVQYMEPGEDYQFDGEYVTEYPVMQKGGRVPIYVDNPNDPRLKAYNDSLNLHRLNKNYIDEWNAHVRATQKAKLTPNITHEKYLELITPSAQAYNNAVNKFLNYKRISNVPNKPSEKATTLDYKSRDNYNELKNIETKIHKKPVQPVEYRKPEQNIPKGYIALTPEIAKKIGFSGSIKDMWYNPTGSQSGEMAVTYIQTPKSTPEPELPSLKRRFPSMEVEDVDLSYKLPEPKTPTAPKIKGLISEEPTNYSYTYQSPSGEQKSIYFPTKSVWKAFVDQYDGLNTQETSKGASASPGVYSQQRRPSPAFKDIKFKNGGVSVNNADAQPVKKLDQLLNFTNYNKPTKGGWLDKYN